MPASASSLASRAEVSRGENPRVPKKPMVGAFREHRGPQLQRREDRGRACVAENSLVREKLSRRTLLPCVTVGHAGTVTPQWTVGALGG